MEEFEAWHSKHWDYLQKVTKLMADRLSSEPEQLIQQSEEIEAHNARIGYLLAEANGYLDRANDFHRPSKDSGTEADRRTIQCAGVSPIRVVRDKLDHLCDTIKQRITLSQSLLAYHRQFADRTIQKGR